MIENKVTFWNSMRLARFIRHSEHGARMVEILNAGKNKRYSIEDEIFVERVEAILEV